jgi:hypothetical protein
MPVIAAVGSTGYNIMLLLHILAVIVAFAPLWLAPVLLRLTAGGDKAAAEAEAKAAAEKAAALQRFDGDAPKVDQLLAKMREMGFTESQFSRDDARVALKAYGHDHSGHDRPVAEIVQIIHSHSC